MSLVTSMLKAQGKTIDSTNQNEVCSKQFEGLFWLVTLYAALAQQAGCE